jgi:NTE family protein
MGAVIGAMYLAYGSAGETIRRWGQAIEADLVPPVRPLRDRQVNGSSEHPLLQAARRIRNQVVVAVAMNRTTVLDDRDVVRAMEFLVPEITVEDLPAPFMAVATDLSDGSEVRLTAGDLRRILKASSAIPGLLPSVEIDGRPLVDGGVVAEVPVAAAGSLGWPVVAVDASMDLPPLSDEDLVFDTLTRTQLMTARLLRQSALDGVADVIRPEVGTATWADWHRFDELVAAGRAAAYDFLGIERGARPSESPPTTEAEVKSYTVNLER